MRANLINYAQLANARHEYHFGRPASGPPGALVCHFRRQMRPGHWARGRNIIRRRQFDEPNRQLRS